MNDNTARPPCASAQSQQSNYANERSQNQSTDRDETVPGWSHNDWSALPWLIRRATPNYLHFDQTIKVARYDATQAELDRLNSAGLCLADSWASTLAVVGKLLVHSKLEELHTRDLRYLGDFLALSGETIAALLELYLEIDGAAPRKEGD